MSKEPVPRTDKMMAFTMAAVLAAQNSKCNCEASKILRKMAAAMKDEILAKL